MSAPPRQHPAILRNGTNGAKLPATLNLSEALSSMDVEMSRAIASLSVFLNKNAEGAQAQDNMTIFYETLETCGYKPADGQVAAFEKPGDIRGKMTLGAKPREIMDKYVADEDARPREDSLMALGFRQPALPRA